MNPARKYLVGGAAALAALAGGAVGASMVGVASAQSTPSASSDQATTTAPDRPAHGTPEHEALETAVSGDAAAKAQAAAVSAAGGGTAGDVTTDASGKGYEVTVTKTDGTQVEYHLDSSFNVMQGGGARHGH